MKAQALYVIIYLSSTSILADDQQQQFLRRLSDPRSAVETKKDDEGGELIMMGQQTEAQRADMFNSCDSARYLKTHQTQTLPEFMSNVFDVLAHVQIGERPIHWVSEHYEYLAKKRGALVDGSWTEFGVFGGASLGKCYDNLKVRNKGVFEGTVAGFDSFEGLPVKWRPGFDAHRFAMEDGKVDLFTLVRSNLPQDIELYKGWFQDTIGTFLEAHPGTPSSLIHHDGDLFVSTAITFALMNERIVPGTLLCFDELMGYPGYEQHEILSLFIWMKEHHATLCPIAAKGPINKLALLDVKMDVEPEAQSACFQVLELEN